MSLLLHLETSAEFCSVCLSKGTTLLAQRNATERFVHAATITVFIEACVKEAGISLAELDAIAVSMGPGSYTGLRIGLSAAKGICYALDKPILAIDTLQALAGAAYKENPQEEAIYLPMIDARRMEVYTATFNHQQKRQTATQAIVLTNTSLINLINNNKKVVVCGNGAEKAKEVLLSEHIDFQPLISQADHMIPLALEAWNSQQFADLAYCAPWYFKRPNITTPKPNVLSKIMNDKNL